MKTFLILVGALNVLVLVWFLTIPFIAKKWHDKNMKDPEYKRLNN